MRADPRLLLLGLVFLYDVVMLGHVHQFQMSLDQVATVYDPLHPVLPTIGRPEARLVLGHPAWIVVLHGVGSAVPLLGSLLQLAAPVRTASPTLHRRVGWTVLASATLFGALPGAVMAWTIAHASLPLRAMVFGLAAIVLGTIAMTARTARRRQLLAHARWGARLTAYLHVIPVVARLYFWAAWTLAGWAQADPGAWTFERIGWLTVLSVVPLGELAAWAFAPSQAVASPGPVRAAG